ncbi:MAG TPA: methyl-accepting chemotaxis protein [Burkholderiaceae bacterium]|nr:methyl-accepting chemotaxis protein [Burkholderiaceae bacterium]
MNLKNLRVAAKLWLSVSVLVIALLGLMIFSTLRSARAQSESEASMQEMTTRVQSATRWAGLTEANAARTQALILSSDPAVETAFKDVIAATSAQITEVQKNIETMNLTATDKAQMEKIASSRKSMLDLRVQARKLKTDGKGEEATTLINNQYNPAVSAYLGNLREFVKMQEQAMTQAQTAIANSRMSTIKIGASAMVVIVLCILGGAYWLIRSILQPLSQANALAARIAEGDLSAQIEAHRHDEFGDLIRSLMAMNNSLGRMVHQVRQSTDSIATASAEIATGNHDLSARTEQTSSNLQQTASSMDQLTSNVRQSADNAQQASALAARASTVAEKGGAVVQQVVATMQDINASSKKISDIIGVIDGIAFQTNILALNAAVEAARAGEQGRGFAVVASEVRSLAQRSAGAAKEIKELIGASVEKVESGARLVADAGSTMGDIVQSVKRVTDIIGEITAASSDQSQGIAEVNQAVGNLDQMTQQNAALVEQSAAAAQSLREQADQLTQVVAVFKINATAHHVTQAAIQHAHDSARATVRTTTKAAPAPAVAPQRKAAPLALAKAPAPKPAAVAASKSANEDWESF